MTNLTNIKCQLVIARGSGKFDFNNKLLDFNQLPIGAIWNAYWHRYKSNDGLSVCVMLPGTHVWQIDQRSSNCTLPNDDIHRCWIRHGILPDVTVDKLGNTCSAGSGSISISGWHGMLTNGYLIKI